MDYSSDDSQMDPDFGPDDMSLSESSDTTGSEEEFTNPRLVESPTHGDDRPSTSGGTDSTTEASTVAQKIGKMVWQTCTSHNTPQFEFTSEYISGMKTIYQGIFANGSPLDFFEVFLSNDIVTLIVDQTNIYATQYLLNTDVPRSVRVHAWTPVDAPEMMRFLGLVAWMGLVKLPSLRDYWRTDELYGIPLARTVMPRNRFELLLKFIHFSDNESSPPGDRLAKIRDVMNKFIHNYKVAYTPGQRVCTDESLIPWRGRLMFRQYIPNKRHRYGIKVFKLCSDRGYTWNMMVYCGKTTQTEDSVAERVVMQLVDGLLDAGRVLYTDNWYTSVPLAYRLNKRRTHLVGTLRLNRKHLPKDVVGAKLKKGEYAAQETGDGIVVLKWRDKRVVSALTTKHSGLETVNTSNRRGQKTIKPACIVDYNTGKSSIDLSDQMASYGTALRRCTKWYRKLFFELLWGTSVVNAHFLYNKYTLKREIKITEFREQIIREMLHKYARASDQMPRTVSLPAAAAGPSRSASKHKLIPKMIGNPLKKTKGRCVECYKIYGRQGKVEGGKRTFARQTQKICSICKVFLCLECFNKIH